MLLVIDDGGVTLSVDVYVITWSLLDSCDAI